LVADYIYFPLFACQYPITNVRKPPEPEVTVEGKNISVVIGSYSWQENGKGVAVDAGPPQMLVEGLTPVTLPPKAKVTVQWPKNCEQISLQQWLDDTAMIIPFTEVENDNYVFELLEKQGTYIYALIVKYDRGNAVFSFHVKVQ
jgi:hypothetical protein